MPKTKIFLSSVNEDGLKPLRQHTFRELQELGHEPLMWEENLGPWPMHVNPVVKCLEAVEASDIYLLFIAAKAGTYYQGAKRTVTHLEFIKACDKGKTVLVFADIEVKALFFGKAKPRIDAYREHMKLEARRYPEPEELIAMLAGHDDLPKHIDPYVWFFLHDMMTRGVFVDDLRHGVPIDWRTYLSDLLRRGTILLPLESSFLANQRRVELLDEAFQTVSDIVPLLRLAPLPEWSAFLRTIVKRMDGGRIEHQYGGFMTETAGTYEACVAATLYRYDDEQNRLLYAGGSGSEAGPAFYSLSRKDSYVVLTYNMGDGAQAVYFTDAKRMFYCCIRSGRYVLTLHVPSGPTWDAERFMLYQESVIDGIINKNPYMIEFIKMALGGMQS